MSKLVDNKIKQATHVPMLVAVFELTKGNVLELGSGYFSTTILRWLCQMSRRTLYSYESSNFWYQKVINRPIPFHKVIKVESRIQEKLWKAKGSLSQP